MENAVRKRATILSRAQGFFCIFETTKRARNTSVNIHTFNDSLMICRTTYTWKHWIILDMGLINERRRYNVTPSLSGWVHTKKDSWKIMNDCFNFTELLLFSSMKRFIQCIQQISTQNIQHCTVFAHCFAEVCNLLSLHTAVNSSY